MIRCLAFLISFLLDEIIAPPPPEVIILLPLNDIHPANPTVDVNLSLNFPFLYFVPRLSAASSTMAIFLFLQHPKYSVSKLFESFLN